MEFPKFYPYRTATTLALGSAVLASAGCSNGGDTEPVPAPQTIETSRVIESSPTPNASQSIEAAYCGGALEKMLPKRKGDVVVDGRCDSAPDEAVGIYAGPTRGSVGVAHADTGAELDADCYVDASYNDNTSTQNQQSEPNGNKANLKMRWMQVKLPKTLPSGVSRIEGAPVVSAGYIPYTWVMGGADDVTTECAK